MLSSIVLLGVIILLYYALGKLNENYWKNRGVVFHNENKIAGVVWSYIVKRKAMFEIVYSDLYKKYPNAPAVGHGSFFTKSLYVRDPSNVNHVLQQDFQSFNHRGFQSIDGDQLSDNITFMNGVRWKVMRQSMTPLFTSVKLKNMFYIMDKSAQDFVNYLKDNPKLLNGDTFETMNTFCSAAIAAAVFGIGTKSIFDSPFLKMAKASVEATFASNAKFSLNSLSPRLFKLLKLKLFAKHEDFFIGAIKQVIRQREQDNTKKHDFADICVKLQSNGMLKDPESGYEMKPTDELMAAQAFFFFIAGVEPAATAIFTTLLELGRHPDILRRVQDEIDESFEKNDGNITYDVVNEMKYLDKVLSEALRMYPPIGFLTRECIQDTVLPVGNIRVDKGTRILTPIYEIHHDPKYYPDPEVFNPERFPAAKNDVYYMPFGAGGRKCIGARYAKVQVLAGLIQVLRHFNVSTEVHKGGIKFKKAQIQVRPINVDVKLLPRQITATRTK